MKLRLKFLLVFISFTVFNFSTVAAGNSTNDAQPLVIIQDYKFIPQEITIKRGQKIRWENREKRQYHSVWFEALGEEEPADYMFPDDESFAYTREFKEAGTFPYRCGPHPKMTGTVHVVD
ncbi:MAG: cupredoxin domain-containing protein [Gammaproteobacteria bacterium]|nr:cupredoxin domain-containing protein [Gammaproteobacteria bacterium]MCW8988270.1 cupredoxin domain-containing protein [Gammaproteobacteria bacterium]